MSLCVKYNSKKTLYNIFYIINYNKILYNRQNTRQQKNLKLFSSFLKIDFYFSFSPIFYISFTFLLNYLKPSFSLHITTAIIYNTLKWQEYCQRVPELEEWPEREPNRRDRVGWQTTGLCRWKCHSSRSSHLTGIQLVSKEVCRLSHHWCCP